MESSESPDSKNVTTISDSQASSSGNDQAIAAQHGNIDEQQLGSDAAMNQPSSSRQSLSNLIANVPNDNVNQQHQQLLNNDLHPRPPINERQQNGPNYQPPEVRPRVTPRWRFEIQKRVPHFHLIFGNQNWIYYNYPRQKVSVRVRVRSPMRPRQQPPVIPNEPPPQVNLCELVITNEQQLPPIQQLNGKRNQVPSTPPPLVSKKEIEPGIFMELYSHEKSNNSLANRRTMYGADRCLCEDYFYYVQWNRDMISLVMNNPSLTLQFNMTISRETLFRDLFEAYYMFTQEKCKIIFVANGQRLCQEDTPSDIGLHNNENIYTFASSTSEYTFSKETTDNSK